MMKENRKGLMILEIVLIVLALFYLYPIFLVVSNSLKSYKEVMTDVIALPKQFLFGNYGYVWQYINYPRLFLNNVIITSAGLSFIWKNEHIVSIPAGFLSSHVKKLR